MSEKNWDVIDEKEPRGQSVTYKGISCTARTCVTYLNRFEKENEELKSDYDTLKIQDDARKQHQKELMKENEELKTQLDCIQNLISEHIKHQKTELGKKALKEVIQDYNNWLLEPRRCYNMTKKRFTVPLRYYLSHSKIQCNGEPLTNDELVRILNTNDGAFLENFNLKEENKQLKQFQEQVASVIESKMGDNVCNDYKMEVLKEIWNELELDGVWFE